MEKKFNKKTLPKYSAFKIALIYFLASFLWILVSDWVVFFLFSDIFVISYLQSYKGIFFISVSALLIYFLANKSQSQLNSLVHNLDEKNLELKTDINQGRKIENSLRASEEKFSLFMDNLPAATYIKDSNGKYKYSNKYMNNLVEKASLEGLDDFDLFPQKSAQKFREDDKWVLQEHSIDIEEHLVDKTNQKRYYRTVKFPIKYPDGSMSLGGISLDITGRIEAEKKLQDLNKKIESKNKELESIIYVTSHDLRSPLVNIQGFSQELHLTCNNFKDFLIESKDLPKIKDSFSNQYKKEIEEYITFISSSVQKINQLLNGLLRLSRLGRSELRMEHVNMNILIKDVINSMKYQIDRNKINLKVEKLDPCYGDKKQLSQVFSNLIDNAIKYLDPRRKGEIYLGSKQENNESIYIIRDNGIGIPREQKDKIFEIFHRISPTRDTAGEGLGLTIVKRIVDRHNGKVWVESEPGKGTTFFISLPYTH